ncbi:MAG: hypothetical protein ACRC6D_15355 [Aeromonas sp.]
MTQYSLFDLLPKEDNQLAPMISKGSDKEIQFRGAIINGVSYFSIIDVINHLMGYGNKTEAKKYWFNIKLKIAKDEPHFQLSRNSRQLKLLCDDGKRYKTECFCLQDSLRIIMSIPSPKVEHIKKRMAQIAEERLLEEMNPDMAIERGLRGLYDKGLSKECAEMRLLGIQARVDYTDQLKAHGVNSGTGFAINTDAMHVGLTGMKTAEHKQKIAEEKGLESAKFNKISIRDNCNRAELASIRAAEELAAFKMEVQNPHGVAQCAKVSKASGEKFSDAWKDIQSLKAASKEITNKS